MNMLMAVSAFEGQLLIIQLLIVMPGTHRDLDCFWKSSLKVHLNTDSCIGILSLGVCLVNVVVETIPYFFQRFRVPAVRW